MSNHEVSICCNAEIIEPDWETAEQMGSLARAYLVSICKKCGKPCLTKKVKQMKVIQNIQDLEFFAKLSMTDIDIYSAIAKNPKDNPDNYSPQPIKWVKDMSEATRFSDVHGVHEVVRGINILAECLMGDKLAACVDFTPEIVAAKFNVGASQINPKHYQSDRMQVIDVINAFGLGFDLGNSIKYILRAGKKDSKEKELRKAIWYIMHHLGWEPHRNQLIAEEFLTVERIELLRRIKQTLKNHKHEPQTSIDEILSDIEELFSLD